jgi:hypothetical protein
MKRMATILLLVPLVCIGQSGGNGSIAELQKLFQNPPDDSRVMMRWWWFGPAVTKPQLEKEMRKMKEGGIGGFEVQPVYPLELDDPKTGIRTLPYLSDEFLDALRFTAGKAKELGLRFDLTLGSGWPYGGPSVPISQAAGRLRVERIDVSNGAQRVTLPRVGAGEQLMATFVARSLGRNQFSDDAREITDIRDGTAWLPSSLQGANTVFFFISSRSGMQVKRPAVGAEGYVVDHFDALAIRNYLSNVADPMIKAAGANRPYAVFTDSLEVYNSDWTTDFLAEFQRRRGYDLKPHLVALATGAGADAVAFRRDWGKTLTELFNERFLTPMHEWSSRNSTRLRVQAYGTPAVALSSNALVDLSEGEGSQWDRFTTSRWASSASHIYGRPVTSSETWTWLDSPPFRATPLDMKAEADRHFLEGVNQLIGHGWPYSPDSTAYPGWHFYAAASFNDKNPWWIVMPDVTRYLQRISFLLRQGQPANDVAIYLPNDDAWGSFTNGNVNLFEVLRQRIGQDVIPALLAAGYNFDFFDDEILKQSGKVENGALRLGSSTFRAVILPNVERMPLESLQKLGDFARGGGALIATTRTPAGNPGFITTAQDRQRFSELSRSLFEGASPAARLVTDEKAGLAGALSAQLQPDVSFSPAVPELGFVHRHVGEAEVYFIANTADVAKNVKASFRVKNLKPEWWDPVTGNVTAAHTETQTNAATTVNLELEPYGSRVLVFTNRSLPAAARTSASVVPQPVNISSGWQVTFGTGGSGAARKQFETLHSWDNDDETRYFSGVATYENVFVVPDVLLNILNSGLEVRLDFGDTRPEAPDTGARAGNGMRTTLEAPVRDAAVVYINDQRVGSVWHAPYSLNVTSFLRSGQNRIRVEVANTAMNYMAGHALPDYRLLNLRYTERFQVQDLQRIRPLPSGLLGPIRLIPASAAR